MNVDSVNEVMQVLHRIESLASTWVLPTSSDAESSRNAYERIRSVCRSIAGTLDDVLLDRVEDSDADSDNEPDNPVRESSSEKSARIAYDRSQCILSRVGSAVTASEFAALFNDHPSASRQKQEDDSLVKLYRGYDDSDLDSWNDALAPYAAGVSTLPTIVNDSRQLQQKTLKDRLTSRVYIRIAFGYVKVA